MNSINLAGKVLLFALMVFLFILSYAWLFTSPPKLTNSDYFERIGWIVATVVALFIRPPHE